MKVDAFLIESVRRQVMKEFELQPQKYHPLDIENLQENDAFIGRFILDVEENESEQKVIHAASQAIQGCLVWRNQVGLNDLTDGDFPKEYFNYSTIQLGQDMNGRLLIYLRVGLYRRLPGWHDLNLSFAFYVLEKIATTLLFNNSNYQKASIFLDLTGAGIGQLDLSFVSKFLGAATKYYPSLCGRVYCYQLPWFMKACCSAILAWLPERHRKLVTFIDERNVREWFATEILAEFAGGKAKTWFFRPQVSVSLEEIGRKNGISELDIQRAGDHCLKIADCFA